mgnify:CR=1 FL=1|jgi:peptide deformylase
MIESIVTDRKQLSKKCKPCYFLDLEIMRNKLIIKDMTDTAKAAASCVGLAANQVGSDKRIILVKSGPEFMALVNPVIFCRTGGILSHDEFCLSYPGKKFRVRRHRRIKVHFQKVTGRTEHMEFYEDYARIVQHEIDHLNGKLMKGEIQ